MAALQDWVASLDRPAVTGPGKAGTAPCASVIGLPVGAVGLLAGFLTGGLALAVNIFLRPIDHHLAGQRPEDEMRDG